jgi:glycosyltransferase involved in cell wall biosynthesis
MARVSVVTPTFGRSRYLKEARACFQEQTYEDCEWVVLDDSPEPDPELARESDKRIRYLHSSKRMSLGEKRNELMKASTGDIIVHFDDDDYYAPGYVDDVVSRIRSKDVLLLNGFFVAPLDLDCFGYYVTTVKRGLGFAFGKKRTGITPLAFENLNIPWIHLCWGFSYVYTRKVWKRVMFPEATGVEDRVFIARAIENGFKVGYYQDMCANAVHTVHAAATSNCYSQFIIPSFMIQSLNRHAFDKIARLKVVHKGDSAAHRAGEASVLLAGGPATASR